MTTMIDAANQYVDRGFLVFPVGQDKKPLTPHGLLDAAVNRIGVKTYWTKWPDAGIGLVTDGLVVLDFDAGHGGLESKELIEAKYGPLPDTRQHETGGGGFHFIYRNPNGHNIRNTVCLGGYRGVDIRANGGYIVVPPSNHKSGHRYKVVDNAEIATAPEWLVKLCTQKPVAKATATGGIDDKIPEGQRDATLTSLAGTMRRKGMSQAAIEAALTAENQARCNPPLPDKDIARIATSVGKYAPDPVESSAGIEDTDSIKQLEQIKQVEQTEHLKQVERTEQINENENFNSPEGGDRPYHNVSKLVEQWELLHKGERFDLDTICRQLSIADREGRQRVAIKLWHQVKAGEIKKSDRLYSYIDKTFTLIEWWKVTGEDDHMALEWPYGHGDDSTFGFAEHVKVSQGDIIVLAGVSNMGKTAFCLNLLMENMDHYPCTLMGNEYKPAKLRNRIKSMDWANPLNGDGTPKFEAIKRTEKWQDIIRPDNINIVDWISLGDNFYQIGKIIEEIQEKLQKGIAVISIQKSEDKALGMGGGFSEHLASLYLTFDFERLTVRKAKEWSGVNPNGKTYGFQIVDAGSRFNNIRELRKCNSCSGTGKSRGSNCSFCIGKGYVDA